MNGCFFVTVNSEKLVEGERREKSENCAKKSEKICLRKEQRAICISITPPVMDGVK